MSEPARRVLGPVPCIACRQMVTWWRVGGLLRLMQGRTIERHQAHRCPAKEAAA